MSDTKKDIYNVSLNQGDNSFRSTFSSILKNDHHAFSVQKTERLASALYIITNFMSVSEPLRTKLRSCALDLVSEAADAPLLSEQYERFGSHCLEVGALLRLAERTGLVSPMNAKILSEEYAELAAFVREHHDAIVGGQITREPKEVTPQPQHLVGSLGHNSPNRTNNNKRHSNRQSIILGLLSKKDKITIKDAAAAIEGCSEKTIQRELMSLVDSGTLVKEGERRWSTYRKAI